MMSPAHGRRADDRTPITPRAAAAFVREWLPPAVVVFAALGGQLRTPDARLGQVERDVSAQREREAATADALTIVGRERCAQLSAAQAAGFGYPCSRIATDGRWPLPRAAASTTAYARPAFVPIGPMPLAAIAPILIPAAPTPAHPEIERGAR